MLKKTNSTTLKLHEFQHPGIPLAPVKSCRGGRSLCIQPLPTPQIASPTLSHPLAMSRRKEVFVPSGPGGEESNSSKRQPRLVQNQRLCPEGRL